MADGPEIGTHTVIVARDGAPDPHRDEALLREVGQLLGLHAVPARPPGMDRPEFRLAEGVSRALADRLAAAAVKAGFTPRVRNRLSIKWSSERGGGGYALAMLAPTLMVLPLMGWVETALAPMPPVLRSTVAVVAALSLYATSVLLALRWQFSRLYLPLVVPRGLIYATVPTDARLVAPIADARAAVDALEAALGDELPGNARADLRATIEDVRDRVAALAAAGRAVDTEAGSGLAALHQRRAALEGRTDPASLAELAQLDRAVASEIEAVDAGERRVTEVVSDLVALRRATLEARAALRAAGPNTVADAIVRLQRDVSALRAAAWPSGEAEGEPHGEGRGRDDAAARAAAAQRGVRARQAQQT